MENILGVLTSQGKSLMQKAKCFLFEAQHLKLLPVSPLRFHEPSVILLSILGISLWLSGLLFLIYYYSDVNSIDF